MPPVSPPPVQIAVAPPRVSFTAAPATPPEELPPKDGDRAIKRRATVRMTEAPQLAGWGAQLTTGQKMAPQCGARRPTGSVNFGLTPAQVAKLQQMPEHVQQMWTGQPVASRLNLAGPKKSSESAAETSRRKSVIDPLAKVLNAFDLNSNKKHDKKSWQGALRAAPRQLYSCAFEESDEQQRIEEHKRQSGRRCAPTEQTVLSTPYAVQTGKFSTVCYTLCRASCFVTRARRLTESPLPLSRCCRSADRCSCSTCATCRPRWPHGDPTRRRASLALQCRRRERAFRHPGR